ncbi:hypothetical protein EDB83DRAFT_476646 [Lactarius deliciosus]|nr:hypothetical protein EDB83DRAFT_476646 [Lactarius deliciosus]
MSTQSCGNVALSWPSESQRDPFTTRTRTFLSPPTRTRGLPLHSYSLVFRHGCPTTIYRRDVRITRYQRHFSLLSRSDPIRPSVVHCLAMTRLQQHMLSDRWEDLDKSIFHFTESILLPPNLWLEHGQIILQALFVLTFALLTRSKLSKQPEDAIFAAKYLRHLRNQPHAHPHSRAM